MTIPITAAGSSVEHMLQQADMATWVTVLEIPCEVQTQEVTHVKDIWNNLSVQK